MAPPRRAPFEPLAAPDIDADHDPGFAVAEARGAHAAAGIPPDLVGAPLTLGRGAVWIGTASWTDPTTLRSGFYPRGTSTAESRLRYYASQFPVVEVDSTYYSLPERATAELWVSRTPEAFSFHVKAHALLTGQPAEVSRLPEALIQRLPRGLAARSRIYAKDLSPELQDAVWGHFLDALEPLHDAGKLGGILLQFPRWFLPGAASRQVLADCATRLSNVRAAVEFRNRLWFESTAGADRTLSMLRDFGLTFVMVDGPQGLESSVPPIAGVTTPALAMVRLHGRRAATWEAGNIPTVERYRYLYDAGELAEWVPRVQAAAGDAERTVVLLNNCYGNYGATNARELIARLLAP